MFVNGESDSGMCPLGYVLEFILASILFNINLKNDILDKLCFNLIPNSLNLFSTKLSNAGGRGKSLGENFGWAPIVVHD